MLKVLCVSVKTSTCFRIDDNDATYLVQCTCCIPIRQDLLSGVTLRAICGGILAIRRDAHVNLEEKGILGIVNRNRKRCTYDLL